MRQSMMRIRIAESVAGLKILVGNPSDTAEWFQPITSGGEHQRQYVRARSALSGADALGAAPSPSSKTLIADGHVGHGPTVKCPCVISFPSAPRN
jgi:hypothetical protein